MKRPSAAVAAVPGGGAAGEFGREGEFFFFFVMPFVLDVVGLLCPFGYNFWTRGHTEGRHTGVVFRLSPPVGDCLVFFWWILVIILNSRGKSVNLNREKIRTRGKSIVVFSPFLSFRGVCLYFIISSREGFRRSFLPSVRWKPLVPLYAIHYHGSGGFFFSFSLLRCLPSFCREKGSAAPFFPR